jgi:hypothetical protein
VPEEAKVRLRVREYDPELGLRGDPFLIAPCTVKESFKYGLKDGQAFLVHYLDVEETVTSNEVLVEVYAWVPLPHAPAAVDSTSTSTSAIRFVQVRGSPVFVSSRLFLPAAVFSRLALLVFSALSSRCCLLLGLVLMRRTNPVVRTIVV